MTLLEDLQSSGPKLIGFVRFKEVTIEQGFTLILAKNTCSIRQRSHNMADYYTLIEPHHEV